MNRTRYMQIALLNYLTKFANLCIMVNRESYAIILLITEKLNFLIKRIIFSMILLFCLQQNLYNDKEKMSASYN